MIPQVGGFGLTNLGCLITKDRSSQDIADEYGCKRNTIQQWLAKFKISKPIVKRHRVNPKPHENRDFLYDEHIVKCKPVMQIAIENNVDYDTIRYHLNKFGIEIKTFPHRKYADEEIDKMVELYCDDGISANIIAHEFGTDHNTIIRNIQSRGIETRGLSEAQFNYYNKKVSDLLNDKEWLERMHWQEGKSCVEIGRELEIDAGTVRRHMHKLGIQTKNNSQSKLGIMVGDKHPNWKGGITPLAIRLREYFHTNQVPKIIARDNYTCMLCGKIHTSLHVHHIIEFSTIVNSIVEEHPEHDLQTVEGMDRLYDIITHDKRFLDESNLITYCRDCHFFIVHGYQKRANETISSQALDYKEGSETIPNGSKP